MIGTPILLYPFFKALWLAADFAGHAGPHEE